MTPKIGEDIREDVVRDIIKKVIAEEFRPAASAPVAEVLRDTPDSPGIAGTPGTPGMSGTPAPAPKKSPWPAPERVIDPSGVIGIRGSSVEMEPFQGREDVRLRDLTSISEAPRIGCGLMELRNGADFPWTLSYDEWDVILEGRLEIKINGNTVGGSAGDCIYIPKGSSIHFTTPWYAKFAYVVYPADWEQNTAE